MATVTRSLNAVDQEYIAKLAGVENDTTYIDEGDPDGSIYDSDQFWIERQGSIVNVMICSHGTAMTLFPGEIDRLIDILNKAREESYKYHKAEIEYSRTLKYKNPPTAKFAKDATYTFDVGNKKYNVHLYVKDNQLIAEVIDNGVVVYSNSSTDLEFTQGTAYDYITLYLKQNCED